MSIGAPRRFGAAVMLSAALGITAALAQTDEPAAKRTWTDPPARGSTAAPAATPTPTPTPVPDPVAAPQKPAARATETRRSTAQAAPRSTAKPVRPRIVERRATRVAAEPQLSPRQSPRRSPRLVQVRRAPPTAAMRYGYAADPHPVVLGGYYEDERLRRLRQAEAAGFLVVRQRSVEFPDGRRLRTYSPYEVDDEEE